MLKTLGMLITGFIMGLLLSENAQVIRHSIPQTGSASGNINQFIVIFGIGNSSNTFELNSYPDNFTTEEDIEEHHE